MIHEQQDIAVVVAKWLPRYGKDWYFFRDAGVLAVSLDLYESGDLRRALDEAGIEARRLRPDERPVLRVTCPLCGRSDQPIPNRRPTVAELGLLRRR